MTAPTCTQLACKTCSACAYSHHEKCAQTVECPNTGEIFACTCCGNTA